MSWDARASIHRRDRAEHLKEEASTLTVKAYLDSWLELVKTRVRPSTFDGSGHPYVQQRFTIAHELGHHLLEHRDRFYVDLSANPQDGDPPEYQSRHERDANEFAADVLMPAALLRA